MRVPATSLACLLLVVALFTGGAHSLVAQVRYEFTEVHMGMPVRIVLYADDYATATSAARAAFASIAELDDTFSDYRASSELRRLESHAFSWVPVSGPLFAVLDIAVDIARLTDGAFDPSVGPLTSLWRDARRTGVLPDPIALDSARRLVGWQSIRLDSVNRAVRLERTGMRLDLGGIAKGYILQAALAVLRRNGIDAALVEAGGDIVVGAAPPGRDGWSIDVAGAAPTFADRAASLTHTAIATSGPTFQYVESDDVRHSHVLDPRTGVAQTDSFIVRVIATDAALADALATAIGVMGPAAAADLIRGFPDVIVDIRHVAKSR